MKRLQCGLLLLVATTLTACKSTRPSLPIQPGAPVSGLYTQVLARHPVGIPADADMKSFAPYLSRALLQKIEAARACSVDWYDKNPGSDAKPEVSWAQLPLFYGEDIRDKPSSFKIDGTHTESDGSIRVSLSLDLPSESPAYKRTEPVAAIVRRENSHDVVDDIVFLSEHWRWTDDHTQQTYTTEDARLSQYLAVGCGPSAKLIQGLYNQVLTRHPHDIPAGDDWKVFAPYFSKALLQKFDVAKACEADWERQTLYPLLKTNFTARYDLFSGKDETYIFTGGNGPTSFRLQLVQAERDGSFRSYAVLTEQEKPSDRPYRWRVAPVVIQEDGRDVIDDIVYTNDSEYDHPEDKPADKRLSGYLAAGCNGPHWIGSTLSQQPEAFVQSLYQQVLARHPGDIPSGEDWKVFAPYMSKALLRRINLNTACMNDWVRQYGDSDPPLKGPGFEGGIFSGGNEREAPKTFQVERTEREKDGSVRVIVRLDLPQYKDVWHVADVLVQENGDYRLDEVIFLKDKDQNREYRLSGILTFDGECRGPRYVGQERR